MDDLSKIRLLKEVLSDLEKLQSTWNKAINEVESSRGQKAA